MATKYGVNATKALGQETGVPSLINQGDDLGQVHCLYDEYVLTGDLAAADVIKFGSKLPAGARIVDAILWATDLDVAGGTMDLGWAASETGQPGTAEVADDDGLVADADVTAAYYARALIGVAGLFKKFTAPVQIQAKVEGDTDATTGTIKCAVFYVLD
jgi:hypothetical protein